MFRLDEFTVISSTELQAVFSQDLRTDLTVGNVEIFSNYVNELPLTVISLLVDGDTLEIKTTPQAPLVSYQLRFRDTASVEFTSLIGDRLQVEDRSNRVTFLGSEGTNEIRDRMADSLPSNYDPYSQNILRRHISDLGKEILLARTNIRQSSNAALLEETVTGEVVVRGTSSTDRLFQESAYKVLRVAATAPGAAPLPYKRIFDEGQVDDLPGDTALDNSAIGSFPSDPVSLKMRFITETISNTADDRNGFDGLIINTANDKVAIVLAVILRQGVTDYQYDIPTHKIGLADNRYDSLFSYRNITLSNNQIKLSDSAVLSGNFPLPQPGDVFTVRYGYIDNRINVDPTTTQLWNLNSVVREIAPALLNVFSLKFAPIAGSDGTVPTLGGVDFIDPSPTFGAPYTKQHPAFLQEIPYSPTSPPSSVGEYAINYETGQVLVFGRDSSANGTGPVPPVCSYTWRRNYQQDVDYAYDADTQEIVAISGRDLVGTEVTLQYRYEQVLAEGADYRSEVHHEALGEYAENRITSDLSVVTLNAPITDVFRVFNETTGETYAVSSFTANKIRISGQNPPQIVPVVAEFAQYAQVSDEAIFIAETVTPGTSSIFKIELANSSIAALTCQKIGSSVDSSLIIASEYFLQEFFYDENQDLSTNLAKITLDGDFLVDYRHGVIYLRAPDDAPSAIGFAGYRHAEIITQSDQIVSVESIFFAPSQIDDPVATWDLSRNTSSAIISTGALVTPERVFDKNLDNPILTGTIAWGNYGVWNKDGYLFSSADALFTSDMADGYHMLAIVGEDTKIITSVVSSTTVTVDLLFASSEAGIAWSLINLDSADPMTVATSFPVRGIRGIYLIDDLQTLPTAGLQNYWDPDVDTFDGNVVTLNNALASALPRGSEALAVDYDHGDLFVSYSYVRDRIIVDYEWGDNEIRWLRPVLDQNQNYFVTYRYGALRRQLIENFAAVSQFDGLISAGLDVPRETIRDLLRALLQISAGGPTRTAMELVGQIPTGITPTIHELYFDDWAVGSSNLAPVAPRIVGEASYRNVRWRQGFEATDGYITMPADRYVSYRNGSWFSAVSPNWHGINNNCPITISTQNVAAESIWIGSNGYHPASTEFTVSVEDLPPREVLGQPAQLGMTTGLFVWFDVALKKWQVVYAGTDGQGCSGSITCNGAFVAVGQANWSGGEISPESTDITRSQSDLIEFDFTINVPEELDGYLADGYSLDGYSFDVPVYADGLSFIASRPNYLFSCGKDTGLAMFRDPAGWLVLSCRDARHRRWEISADIRDWAPGDVHTVGASWALDSIDGADSMHLFVDGKEVSNIMRWGSTADQPVNLREVAQEDLGISPKNTFIVTDGSTTAGSPVITSSQVDFVAAGVVAGDLVSILENTTDGVGSPYTIVSVTANTLTLGSPLNLTLGSVKLSLNPQEFFLSTNVDGKFAVFANGVELPGPRAANPQYEIARDSGVYKLSLYGGVVAGDQIIVETLGLSTARNRVLTLVD